MKTINISVRDKIAVNMSDIPYTCGNSDFVINFDFDEEWDEFSVKTARFIKDDRTYQDQVFQGNECPVPILYNTNKIRVGVFAGNLNTSTPAIVPANKGILCGGGSPEAPSEDVYAQIMEMLNATGGGSGCMSAEAKDLLLTILRNGEYSTDQTENIAALEEALSGGAGGEANPDEPIATYTVTSVLFNVTSTNPTTALTEGASYTATLTADDGYALDSVTVTMGGVDVTDDVYAGGVVNIVSVTGDIIITASAVELTIYSEVTWLDTAYGIGDNTVYNYNGWAPGCAHYDATLGKVVFLQCHASAHSSNATWNGSQLWAINPYNVMEAELLYTFETTAISFAIYQGKYYVATASKTFISADHGKTWKTVTADTKPGFCYGLTIIDDVMYTGNDALADGNNGIYYTSSDFGKNWATHTFDFADSYSGQLTCSEASFVKFNGKIYAGLRRETEKGLLAVQDGETGVWSVISEELPNVKSDTYFYATSDTLCYCAIDRSAMNLHVGRIVPSGDSANVIIDKTWNFGFSGSGDFHTPTYIYGPDFQMLTMMCGIGFSEYKSANNICVVGYTDLALNNNPTYSITRTNWNNSYITETPYVVSSPRTDGVLNQGIEKGSVYNLTKRATNVYPLDEGGNVYVIKPNPYWWVTVGTSNVYGYTGWDGVEQNGQTYACLVKTRYSSAAWTGIKVMTKGMKNILVNVDELGGIVPEDGVFEYAFYAPVSTSGGNWGVLSESLITATYEEPVKGVTT